MRSFNLTPPQYLSMLSTIARLPWPVLSYPLARQVSRYFHFRFGEKHQVMHNFRLTALAEKRDAELFWRSYLDNLSIGYLNTFYYHKMDAQWLEQHVEIQGQELLEQASRSRQGVLFLSAHQHYLIFVCVLIGLLKYRIHGILFDPENTVPPALKQFNDMLMKDSADHFNGGKYLLVNYKNANIRPLIRAFEHGDVLVSANDFPKSLSPKRRMTFPFLGKQISCPMGTVMLAKKTHSKIVFGYVKYLSRGRFQLIIKPMKETATEAEIMAQYAGYLQDAITDTPGSWDGWKWGDVFE